MASITATARKDGERVEPLVALGEGPFQALLRDCRGNLPMWDATVIRHIVDPLESRDSRAYFLARISRRASFFGAHLSNRQIQFTWQLLNLLWKFEVHQEPDFGPVRTRLEESGQTDPRGFPILDAARRRIKRLLGPAPAPDTIVPRVGPGSFVERYRGVVTDVSPWCFAAFEPVHPFPPLYTLEGVSRSAPYAHLAYVPKDVRGVRFIALEPAARQAWQGGVREALMRRMPRDVNLEDTTDHRLLSTLPQMGTIDLADASDLISNSLVKFLFPPDWWMLMSMSRSPFISMPDGSVFRSGATATMGNGFCFAMLTIVCWALCRSVLPPDAVLSVFGDDIVVENRYFPAVFTALRSAGLRVNIEKSFTGPFRETCGFDTYDGLCISPVRLRDVTIWSRWTASGRLSSLMPNFSRELVRGLAPPKGSRWNKALQRIEFRSWVQVPVARRTYDYVPYRAWFCGASSDSALRGKSELKTRWVCDPPESHFTSLGSRIAAVGRSRYVDTRL